jgi:hypothetical protein
MAQFLDKRTADQRTFDIDCSQLLTANETISSVTNITADRGNLTFAAPIINSSPITYPDGRQVAIGKVIQVQISGGAIPTSAESLMCTIRAVFVTSVNPAVEATVLLRLIDSPNVY